MPNGLSRAVWRSVRKGPFVVFGYKVELAPLRPQRTISDTGTDVMLSTQRAEQYYAWAGVNSESGVNPEANRALD